MHEYLRNANEAGRTVNIFQLNYMFLRCVKQEVIDAVKDKLIKMIHSRDGARVAIYCLWYGTNKV